MVEPFLPVVAECAERWIVHQRNRYRGRGQPLDSTQLDALLEWFNPHTLESVRLVRTWLRNPAFSPQALLPMLGSKAVLDLRKVGGITLGDTVVINESVHPDQTPIRLLFHEIVHVAQFRQLGIRGFAEHYLRGWIESGFDYRQIPLELEAYRIEAEFVAGSVPVGTVEERLASLKDYGRAER